MANEEINVLHSREAEEAVIGAALLNPQVIDELIIEEADFYLRRHGFIWAAMRQVGSSNLDYVTLIDQLEKNSNLEEVGGPAFVTAMLNRVPSSQNAERYAQIILDYKQRRNVLEISQNLTRMVYSGDELNVSPAIDHLSSSTKVRRESRPAGLAASGVVETVRTVKENPRDVWGYSTGFGQLDLMLGGVHPELTTVIAGEPGVGKTMIFTQALVQMAMSGVPCAIYSLEMSERRVLMRILSYMTNIQTRKMQTGGISNQNLVEIERAKDKIATMPLYINDTPGMTTGEIRADLIRLVRTYGVKVVLVDYLGLLGDNDAGDDLSNTKEKMRRMQTIFRETRVGGFLIQSMNKGGMSEGLPTMANLSGPSSVAFDADNIFFIVHSKNNQDVVQLLPAKLRDGDIYRPIYLKQVAGLPRFEDYDA